MKEVTMGIMKEVEVILFIEDVDERAEAWGEFLDVLDISP